ncbi:MAG TPA: CPBP family glutamic-type intramembrane protease [Chitinophagales bacterium]|nr:CPBP family glutamic-type intramembrane protease [Chitinophagales bacterium]
MSEELSGAIIRISPFLIIILIIAFFIRMKRFNRTDIYLQKPFSEKRFFAWCGCFLVFIIVTEIFLFQSGLLAADPWNHSLLPSIIRIAGAVILAPVAEELFFRGLLLFRLEQFQINRHVAIVIQACLFVLAHNFTYENTTLSNIGVVQSFIDGTLYGYAKYHTKSLYTPIAMHMTGNLVATLERFIL